MRKKTLLTGMFAISLLTGVLVGCKKKGNEDEYEDGKLKISFRNLYFDDYTVGDDYLKEIEKKFEISVSTSAYSWSDWNTQVNSAVMGGELDDVFHANIDAYNFASYYKYWADNDIIKPLPDDLSKWPYLKAMIDNTTNIQSLKVNGGHLYGIPIAKNTTDYSTKFSPFTYIYRRDWAEDWEADWAEKMGDPTRKLPADDVYTWEEFEKLVEVFAEKLNGTQAIPFGDVEWGFPSVTNFYKQVPHCFAQDASGHYVNNYTTADYLKGLEKSKDFRANRWYAEEEGTAPDGTFNTKFTSNLVGIFYENLSYSNYINIRTALKDTNASDVDFDLDKATRIMKIKCPTDSEYAGKFALEGTDNWFSMTFLNYDISDNKMNKILDLYDWLLSPEGTWFAIYGFEGYEYRLNDDGKPEIIEENWDKDENGNYSPKRNGAKYLRYMVSLGYDTLTYDPFTDKAVVEYLNDWEEEMKEALDNGQLHVLKETPEVMWLTTPKKAEHSGTLRTEALKIVKRYVIGDKEIRTQNDFISQIKDGKWKNQWDEVLSEINRELGV